MRFPPRQPRFTYTISDVIRLTEEERARFIQSLQKPTRFSRIDKELFST